MDVINKTGLKGFYILEDHSPTSDPDISSNFTTFIPAIDNQLITYSVEYFTSYIHVQAADSAGNLSAVYSLSPPDSYNISVSANPPEGGTVIGNDTYFCNDTAIVKAIPNEGYIFENWTEDGIEVSINTVYSFIVTEDRTLVANFTLNTYNITVLSNLEVCGTAAGEGTYNYGDYVTVVATTIDTCCVFINWTEDGIEVSTDAVYSFTVTKDRTLVANFDTLNFIDTYTIIICDKIILLNLRKLAEDGYEVTGCKWFKNGIEVTKTPTKDEFSYSEDFDKLLEPAPTYYMYQLITRNYGVLCPTEKIIISRNKASGCLDAENSSNLLAYPNPVPSGSLLTLEGVVKDSSIYVYNHLGACVRSINATADIMTFTLDLPQGIYLIRAEDKVVRVVIVK